MVGHVLSFDGVGQSGARCGGVSPGAGPGFEPGWFHDLSGSASHADVPAGGGEIAAGIVPAGIVPAGIVQAPSRSWITPRPCVKSAFRFCSRTLTRTVAGSRRWSAPARPGGDVEDHGEHVVAALVRGAVVGPGLVGPGLVE